MGVITSGILGGFSGKVGPVVGGSWKGISYMRQLPASVANPQTAAQTAQRNKLGNCVAFAKEILTTVIKPLNDRFAQGESGYNSFVSRNIALFTAAAPSTPSDLSLSEGSLLPSQMNTPGVPDGDTTVTFQCADESGTGNAQATDDRYIVVYNETQGTFGISSADAQRDDTNPTVELSADAASGDDVHAWMSMRSANGFAVSTTVYSAVDVT